MHRKKYSNGQRLWEVGFAEVSAIGKMVCGIAMPAQTTAAAAKTSAM
jgi:hypothetical protein